MSSVQLNELWRTTSFRLALLFAGLFGAAALLLFGFVYWRTFDYVSHEVDGWLARELNRAVLPATELVHLLNIRALAQPDGRHPLALFGSHGEWLAGNRLSLPSPLPLDQPFHLAPQPSDAAASFRAMAHRLPTGEVLLVARDMRDVEDFHEGLLGALGAGGLVALLLALTGAAVVGAGALGRIDEVTRAIERIIDGELRQRLPSDGRGGDVDRLIQVVNRMLDEIERLMHEVKGVTENIAHDLRTPLTRLLAGLERARRRASSARDYEAGIDEAITETKGILATFTALLRIAELESGARRAGFSLVDLNIVAEDVAELYEPVAEGKGMLLSVYNPAAPVEVAADASLLFEAVSNLVDNAIKYSPPGSRITVNVFATKTRVGLEVGDTGPGIPKAERSAVLRRFHRLDKSRGTPGCGLGLSLVAGVAKLHDCHFAIEDACPGCRVVLWWERQALKRTPAGPAVRQDQPALSA